MTLTNPTPSATPSDDAAASRTPGMRPHDAIEGQRGHEDVASIVSGIHAELSATRPLGVVESSLGETAAPSAEVDGSSSDIDATRPLSVVERVASELDVSATRPLGVGALLPSATPDQGSREDLVRAHVAEVLDMLPHDIASDVVLTTIGLESLSAVRLGRALRSKTGVNLPMTTFVNATVSSLAAELAARAGDAPTGELPVITPASTSTPSSEGPRRVAPMTAVQAAYWVGRSSDLAFGGVAAFYYTEWDRTPEGDPLDDAHTLRRAWDQVVRRHAALRTVVDARGRQTILDEVPADVVDIIDLRHVAAHEAEQRLAEFRDLWSHQVRDPSAWPLFDIHVVLHPGGTRVAVGTDALALDLTGWSTVMRDWGVFVADEHADLPAPSATFLDAWAHRESQRGAIKAADEAYWRSVVDALPAGPTFPWDTSVGTQHTHRFVRRQFQLNAADWAQFRDHAAQAGVSPTGAVLAAYALVLHRWGASEPFTLATTQFDPPEDAHADVVGDWTTIGLTPVVTPNLATWEGFGPFAAEVTHQFWTDLEHRSVNAPSFRAPHVAPGQTPDHPVTFTSGLTAGGAAGVREAADPDAWIGTQAYGVSQTPQVVVDHFVDEREGGLRIRWDVADQVLPDEMFDGMLAAEETLLRRLAADAEAWHDRTLGWDPTFAPTVAPRTASPFDGAGELLVDPWLRSAREHPTATAVEGSLTSGGERVTVTHAELLAAAEHLAEALRAQGCGRGDLVAVSLSKGPAQIASILGVQLAHAAYIPIDPTWPAERVASICEQASCSTAVIATSETDDERWPTGTTLLRVAPHGVVEQRPTVSASTAREADPARPDDLAYAIFTSGSTGKPKGVAIQHQAARCTIDEIVAMFPLGVTDRVLALSAASFDLSVHDIFGVLASGGALVMPDPEHERDPDHWLDLCEKHQVTVWNTAPALMEMLVEYSEFDADRARRALASLRLVMLSGDWIPVTLPSRLKALAPHAVFLSLGGATEAAIWSNTFRVDAVDPAWPSIPYGRALPGQAFHIIDDEGRPTPVGEPGELHISGGGLAREYIGAPEQTAAAFSVEPGLGFRTYRTGDLGRWRPDGQMEFLGRKDRQVKIRGHRIELAEVEAGLVRHPAIRAAVASALPGPDARPRLVAHVVVAEGAEQPTIAELGESLRDVVPSYMVPATMVFLPELPLTANGKVDYRALPNPYAGGRGAAATPVAETAADPAEPETAAAPAMPETAAVTSLVPVAESEAAIAPVSVTAPESAVVPENAGAFEAAQLLAAAYAHDVPLNDDVAQLLAAITHAARHGAGITVEMTLPSRDLSHSLITAGETLHLMPEGARPRFDMTDDIVVAAHLPASAACAVPTHTMPTPALPTTASSPAVMPSGVGHGVANGAGAGSANGNGMGTGSGTVNGAGSVHGAGAGSANGSSQAAVATTANGSAPSRAPRPAPAISAHAPGAPAVAGTSATASTPDLPAAETVRDIIVEVLSDLLETPIAADAPFMEAGATSVTLVLAQRHLSQRFEPLFDVTFTVVDLFAHPSASALATYLLSIAQPHERTSEGTDVVAAAEPAGASAPTDSTAGQSRRAIRLNLQPGAAR